VVGGSTGYTWLGANQRGTDSTGLALMGARLYNPTTGTFTSTDPVYGGNDNSYTYPNDPINEVDLTGKWCLWQVGTTCTRYVTGRYGRTVPVSYAARGKAAAHGIGWGTLQWLIRNLPQYDTEGLTGVRYQGWVKEVSCSGALWWRSCSDTGNYVEVRLVVDFRTMSNGNTKGLVTAYCLGMQVCPSWINNGKV
jgi:RHS repeat-associated protein